jgi:GGDEF domain-containing protein
MLSLKRFLNISDEEAALRKVVSLLLERIGADAVEGDEAKHDVFQKEIEDIRERVSGDATPDGLFLAAGSAVQAMESYNRQVTTLLRAQGGELHSIVSMIAESVVRIGGEHGRSAQHLQEIGDKFERAGALDDLKALKSHLGDCLHSFREETERQKAESDAIIQSLQQEVERRRDSTAAPAVARDLDAVTGLPRAAAGLRAMQDAIKTGQRRFVVAMVVNRIQAVNARFGFHVGDRILRIFKENVEKQLMRGDQLFRWDGPTILILLDRTEPIEQVRSQIRRILDTPLEETFEVEGRSVLIPISASWSTFPLLPPLSNATRQIQAFTASQGYRE